MLRLRPFIIFIISQLIFLNSCYVKPFLFPKPQLPELDQLQPQIENIISKYDLTPAFLGIHIENLTTGKVIYSLNAQKLFIPASNMKIITSAAALSLLGPDFRFTTKAFLRGKIQSDTLNGDIVVRGMGDPTIVFIPTNQDSGNPFGIWYNDLKNKGIRYIKGTLIADLSQIESGWGENWSWDDLWYYYSAKPGPLVINENCLEVEVFPNSKPNEIALLQGLFSELGYEIKCSILTGDDFVNSKIDFYRVLGYEKFVLTGIIPTGAPKVTLKLAVEYPELYFLKCWQFFLKNRGIEVEKLQVGDNYFCDSLICLPDFYSPPLKEIIRKLNKESDNLYAEQLLRLLGLIYRNKGSVDNGKKVIHSWLSQVGIDTNRIFITDGSGLARTNLLTPESIVQVLKYMRSSPYWQNYLESLPIGGVDGTLAKRFQGYGVVGHVYAKTGYVARVRSLSGYIFKEDGNEYVFSIIVNHYPGLTKDINQFQDELVNLIYEHRLKL